MNQHSSCSAARARSALIEKASKLMRAVSIAILSCLVTDSVYGNQAVSAYTGKVEGLYGNIDGETGKGVVGNFSMPVGDKFGVRWDGLYAEINPDHAYGAGLHAFWREPSTGLLGLTASHVRLTKTEATRVGIEGEYYLDRFTFVGAGGYQDGDIESSAYGGLQAGYYPKADLLLTLGITTTDSIDRYGLGIEYQPETPGVSVFANFALGDNNYEHVFFGLKVYIDPRPRSLFKRHREDDPVNNLFGSMLDVFMMSF